MIGKINYSKFNRMTFKDNNVLPPLPNSAFEVFKQQPDHIQGAFNFAIADPGIRKIVKQQVYNSPAHCTGMINFMADLSKANDRIWQLHFVSGDETTVDYTKRLHTELVVKPNLTENFNNQTARGEGVQPAEICESRAQELKGLKAGFYEANNSFYSLENVFVPPQEIIDPELSNTDAERVYLERKLFVKNPVGKAPTVNFLQVAAQGSSK